LVFEESHGSLLVRLVDELLRYRRTAPSETKALARLKHNADLCPRFQQKLENILGSFEKYRKIVYDIQGLHDEGTDILLREVVAENPWFICLQIKSEDDVHAHDILKSLKAQFFDSSQRYGDALVEYYVLLCCDAKKNKDIIRAIAKQFDKQKNVTLIEPEYTLSFLDLEERTIDAIIRAKIGHEDVVYQKALNIVVRFSPTERAIVFYFVWQLVYRNAQEISFAELKSADFLRRIYESTKKQYPRRPNAEPVIDENLARDLEYLCDHMISQTSDGRYSLEFKGVTPLVAIMVDGQTRYGYEDNELLMYMMDVFNIEA
jgi:hypothetical protein